METIQALFIVIYVIVVTTFLLMPKTGFNNIIKKDMDHDFNPKKIKNVAYYKNGNTWW